MRIVLLGPPASGKGTQGRRLAASLGLGYLSTGALLRENIENGTALGLAAEPILARGGYLPDGLICPIVADWLVANDAVSGWVLDGFPRSLRQAEFLDAWLLEKGVTLGAAVALEVPFAELLRRIQDRVECPDCRWSGQGADLPEPGKCPKCGGDAAPRADDSEANFRNRHAEFLSLTVPVIDFYRETGRLVPVPATGTKDETAATILSSFA
ncbi:nucleoside monophosphate kinase [Akkermansiaceae bacterium]|nr:nucleoside monophosphate kinase [Akkermansiaceae bacterium]